MGSMTRQSWEKSWKQISGSIESVRQAASLEKIENLRLEILGRKGALTQLLKDLKDLPIDDRRELGGPANEFKDRLTAAIDSRRAELENQETSQAITGLNLDLTLPGTPPPKGHLHPLTLVMREMTAILSGLGFSWAEGPHVETDYYNFAALNIPEDHPARDMHDTFYLKGGSMPPSKTDAPGSLLLETIQKPPLPGGEGRVREANPSTIFPSSPPSPKGGRVAGWLLRTHTSPVQIRRMESSRPPIRVMVPGRTFRHEATDASHSAVFHQIEGLYVDRNVSMADLKGTLQSFLQSLFGPKTQTRFRPSFFPFTEPSAEVDIRCVFCAGSGCGVCKRSGWLEVLGAGVVHPNVFKAVGYDPNTWSGFAFGMGVERIALLRLGVNDIRMFYQNDLRFLEQFR